MVSKPKDHPAVPVIDWLLETENPSVRFFALRDLMAGQSNTGDLQKAQADIMAQGLVPKILSLQNPDGSWDIPGKFYTSKYKGAVWNLLLLAELGADPQDVQVRQACEFILQHSQHPESGGFSFGESIKAGGGLASGVIPCLTGNMVYSLVKLGFQDDVRVQQAIQWLVSVARADDGDSGPPEGDYYQRFYTCYDAHSCHMGVAKAFKALAAIPPDRRTPAIQAKIDAFAEYFLIHHLYKKSHDLSQVSRPGWLRLTFPLMYQTDILELLGIFADLDHRDPRLEEAIQVLRQKQQPDGRWNLDNTMSDRMLVRIEHMGEPSKWITLKAMRVLRWCEKA